MICNVHTRTIPVEPERVGELVEQMLDPRRTVWPTKTWPMIEMDNGYEIGSDGGHGPIRYAVSDHRPGRRVEFRFAPDDDLDGTHALEIHDGLRPGTTLVRHTLIARPKSIRARLGWSLAIRWMHDALLEELLDNVETAMGAPPARPARWSPWVRFLRARFG